MYTPDLSTCVGILLAAGAGSRFRQAGGTTHKLQALLPTGQTVAVQSALHLRDATGAVLAMVAADDALLSCQLTDVGCTVIAAPAVDAGMGATLAAAAAWLQVRAPRATHALVALADMPWISRQTLHAVAGADRAHPVVAPSHAGRRGHPVRFARSLWPELAALTGDTGARAVLARHPPHAIEVDDPGVLRDVDLPADLL
ncbi:NTP transferase domain-containing protein [Pseudomonadota bacterium AL_CKDN230030165-1A_HGKHYDSX7]